MSNFNPDNLTHDDIFALFVLNNQLQSISLALATCLPEDQSETKDNAQIAIAGITEAMNEYWEKVGKEPRSNKPFKLTLVET